MKLTATQVGAKIGVTSYTIKRWYEFYNDLDEEEIEVLARDGMPRLPKYEVAGSRGDRLWNEEDVHILEKFKTWVPHTRNGVFKQFGKGAK